MDCLIVQRVRNVTDPPPAGAGKRNTAWTLAPGRTCCGRSARSMAVAERVSPAAVISTAASAAPVFSSSERVEREPLRKETANTRSPPSRATDSNVHTERMAPGNSVPTSRFQSAAARVAAPASHMAAEASPSKIAHRSGRSRIFIVVADPIAPILRRDPIAA